MSTPSPLDPDRLQAIAAQVGTPYWILDAVALRRSIADVVALTAADGLQARFAMKANSAKRVLEEMRSAGLWIDAVSANECRRALGAGYSPRQTPPEILYTADVFRDDWQSAILSDNILPNLGSPGMIRELQVAGYEGDIALRANPGFGHGHVNACDTGGPSSKHGIWFEEIIETARIAKEAGMRVVMLHAHIGSGPLQQELRDNLTRLAREFEVLATHLPDLNAVSLGGGLPYDYHGEDTLEIELLAALLREARERIGAAVGRDIRLEIEPGRYLVAAAGTLVTRVTDVKATQTNEKGDGETFAMVDAGFIDLVRPAMYGSYHRITVPTAPADRPEAEVVVAGPLCESGDVFTRDSTELLAPRRLPRPETGDLLAIHDGGAYGYMMASNYNSIGRAPQVWLEEDGAATLVSRREVLADITQLEVNEAL